MMDFLLQTDQQVLFLFNGSNSLFADGLAGTLTMALTWVPLYISLFWIIMRNNENMRQILLVVMACALCFLLSDGLAEGIMKPVVARLRPCQDPSLKIYIDTVEGFCPADYSFFSGHASNTFSIAIFFALLVRQRTFTLFMVVWSLVNCWTRLYLGVHFPSDIIVGLLWGGIVGICVYLLYLRFCQFVGSKPRFVSTHYTSTGYALVDLNVVYTVMVLTFIYAVIRSVIIAI